jgi:hypothetical protein
MAVSSRQEISWQDKHTTYLSHLYTLYCRELAYGRQLCNLGYRGFPDPVYETDSQPIKPDFLAYGEEGDIQHIALNEFAELDDPEEEDISQAIDEVEKYQKIDDPMVCDYLDLHDIDPDIDIHEITLLVPNYILEQYPHLLRDAVRDRDWILWTIETNGVAEIWKVDGDHANLNLDTEMEAKYESYPKGTDFLRFTRKSDRTRIQFEFIQRLILSCSRDGSRDFHFNEIDEIMIEKYPPLLGHLPRKERIEYWKPFIHSLLNTYELLESTGQNEYQWKKKQFVKEPRYRQQILTEMKSKLGLGDGV